MSAGAIVGGIGKAFGGAQQAKFGRSEAQKGEAKYKDQLAAFRSGKFDSKVSAEMAKSKTLATGLAADATKRASDRAAAQQQQLLASAGRGDVRGLAAAAGQAKDLEAGIQQAEQAGAQQILGAQAQFGQYAAGVQAGNESSRRQLEAMELARGAARFDAGRLTQQEGKQAAIAGATEAGAAAANMAFPMAKGGRIFRGDLGMRLGGPEEKDFASEFSKDDYSDVKATEGKYKTRRLGRGKEDEKDEQSELERLQERLKQLEAEKGTDEVSVGEGKSDTASLLAVLTAPSTRFAEAAGQTRSAGNEFMKQGGYVGEEGGKTEGEFSHEENPIDMVNEDGEKVGEVTGGELVFNPEQTQTMQQLIDTDEPEMLMEYLKDLLSQPQFR